MDPRRDFLRKSAAAALTTSLFTGNVKGANDRVRAAFIGMGRMGRSNLGIAMKQDNLEAAAVCDVYKPHLERAVEMTEGKAKGIRDFREILADKTIDAVCIATPDHWHPYMTVEACKAGKDVYVEKPICVTIDEGVKMVQAARKYRRVVQAGTMQRSGTHFQKAVEIVKSGELGPVTFVKTWNYAVSCRRKASAIHPTRSRRPISIGTCGWEPAPASVQRRRPIRSRSKGVPRTSVGSGTTQAG
ncbi:MAG: Gfo/Idh/MocA family oxidoreductase [Bryobacteraceae bacterium]